MANMLENPKSGRKSRSTRLSDLSFFINIILLKLPFDFPLVL